MNIIDSMVYTLQTPYSFNYPSTLYDLKKARMKSVKKIWLRGGD